MQDNIQKLQDKMVENKEALKIAGGVTLLGVLSYSIYKMLASGPVQDDPGE